MKIQLNKPVLILWEDILDLPAGWMEMDEALDHEMVHDKKLFTVEQYGIVLSDEDDYILVTSAIFQDRTQMSHVTRIPRGAVISVSYLEEKKSTNNP